MPIYQLSRFLAAPFVFGFAYILYNSIQNYDKTLNDYLLPLGVIIMVIYVFHNQIDLWWSNKYPIPLDKKDREILNKHSRFYRELSDENKKIFENRVHNFIREKEFLGVGKEKREVPYDFKLLTAMIALEISFNSEKPLYKNFDKIIFYKHPFPTPNIKKLHTVELHGEDGVVLIALDHLSAAIHEPYKFYHVGYHAFAEAYIYEHKKADYPENIEWDILEKVSNFPRQGIQSVLGLEAFDLLPIGIYMYFVFGDKMQTIYPDLYAKFRQVFNPDFI